MTPAERILLSLDAHECWGRPREPAARVGRPTIDAFGVMEAVVIQHDGASDFGILGFGLSDKSADDLGAFTTTKDREMAAIDSTMAASAADQKLVADWHALQARYATARAQAVAAIAADKTAWIHGGGDLNTAWMAIVAAMANVPVSAVSLAPSATALPDSSGSIADIHRRLTAAGKPPPKIVAAQPPKTASDTFMQVTDPKNIADAAKKALDDAAKAAHDLIPQPWRWMIDHKNVLVIGAVVVVGGVAFMSILPMLLVPAKIAKGVTALAA